MKTGRTNILAVIPARYSASRFPGKPLAPIQGIPMILWVLARASTATLPDKVVVATDDARIYDVVTGAGGEAVMTSPELASGSDRVAEVMKKIPAEIVVNVQGDEPLIEPAHIDLAIQALIDDPSADVSTLASPISNSEEYRDEHTVKVVVDSSYHALYFSRASIPFANPFPEISHKPNLFLKHIGLYVFRSAYLKAFTQRPACQLEKTERLEQLRILYHGGKIRISVVADAAPSVDTPEDLKVIQKKTRDSDISLEKLFKPFGRFPYATN